MDVAIEAATDGAVMPASVAPKMALFRASVSACQIVLE
jgi:DNA-binding transcriptional regulator YdaS (Cro superfamily)